MSLLMMTDERLTRTFDDECIGLMELKGVVWLWLNINPDSLKASTPHPGHRLGTTPGLKITGPI